MNLLKRALRKAGLIATPPAEPELPPGYGDAEKRIYELAKSYTATDAGRILALIEAVRYVLRANVPGDFVECGVWRGGSSMVMAAALKAEGVTDRRIHLFDTFEGMAKPDERDVNLYGESALDRYATKVQPDGNVDWCATPLDEVRRNMALTGYPAEQVIFAKGRVEETLPGAAPETIALLRLDTDWYEGTRHEMIHLYPRLSPGGVLIIDDYHWWKGSREAVDEYTREQGINLYFAPIGGGGVAAIKPRA